MDNEDLRAIDSLFGKLRDVEHRSPPRDPAAEAAIRDRIAAQPGAPYYMAQTIIVQEQALEAAQRRIEDLERQLAQRPASGGGFLSGLFGGGQRHHQPQPRPHAQGYGQPGYGRPPYPQQGYGHQAGPWGAPGMSRGGGFLAGAAQTAMGVAGGVLLGNAIMGMFDGNEAQAAEAPPEEPDMDTGADDGDFGDFGSDEF